jgi:cytochrome c
MAVAGPRYRVSDAYASLPRYYDDTVFIADWMNGWIKVVKLDEEGEALAIHDVASAEAFLKPMGMDVGPDGRVYFIEFGTVWGPNDAAQISRLEYRGAPR